MKKLIAPADEKDKIWCRSCKNLSASRNFCLKGPIIEDCNFYIHDKNRDPVFNPTATITWGGDYEPREV